MYLSCFTLIGRVGLTSARIRLSSPSLHVQNLNRSFIRYRAMSSPAILAAHAALASVDLSSYDPEQSRLMDERCILVDEQDNAIGAMDKKTCKSINTILNCVFGVQLGSDNGIGASESS